IVKGVFLKDMPPEVVLANTVPLILIAAVTLSVAAWFFRQRME
ncbi:MAG: ABC transporter permease, partial [Alphaproteobacteria bacterium]|nr:ABC transporter permease [Alphaproteobacteria bacterium]